jgi:hypothetical protein
MCRWSEQYYGGHYARLQAAKRMWDADGVFSHRQSVRPSPAAGHSSPHSPLGGANTSAEALGYAGDADGACRRHYHGRATRGLYQGAAAAVAGLGGIFLFRRLF